ncbi:MAG: hypothetical protein NC203_12035 [Firmicutes bacterium]|nr:hypothetical protein [[Eubacterium] siraeum]MCM1489083.1 hypothetical protein [Bacillota bacterium]
MKRKKLIVLLTAAAMLVFSGCNNAETPPENSVVSLETEITSTYSEETMPETSENTVPETSEETEPPYTEPEYNFICYITEEDIDYMGKPYKDLTPEETVQLWAQCTREMNTQRLYLIEDMTESWGGDEEKAEEAKKDWMVIYAAGELYGTHWFGYHNVEITDRNLSKYGDGGEGAKVYYELSVENPMYTNGEKKDGNNYHCINLTKKNGYWRVTGGGTGPFIPEDYVEYDIEE